MLSSLRNQTTLIVGITIGGVGLLSYALYDRQIGHQNTEELITRADLEVPLLLEHQYGDFRSISKQIDPLASAYLNHIPETYFQFNQNFTKYLEEQILQRIERRKRVLVIGSSTGKLPISLASIFTEVIGIESSLSKVVTSFRILDGTLINYSFPLEGAYRTVDRKFNLRQIVSSGTKTENLQGVRIIHLDPNKLLSSDLGFFQVLIFADTLNSLDDPETILESVHRLIQFGGLLVIASDYNWKRKTNKSVGFKEAVVKNSFEFLSAVLGEFFDLADEKHIPDIVPESLRSCRIRNCHITVWIRNNSGSNINLR